MRGGVSVDAVPENRITELVAKHLEDRRALLVDVTGEEDLDWIVIPLAPHDRTAGTSIAIDRLLLREQSVVGSFIGAEVLLVESLFHEGGEAFVQPDVRPATRSE